MASPRYQKQLMFTEDEWRLIHNASKTLDISSASLIKDAALSKAKAVTSKQTLVG